MRERSGTRARFLTTHRTGSKGNEPVSSRATAQEAPLQYQRVPFLALAIVSLVAGLVAGLSRLGWLFASVSLTLNAAHGPLMVCGFLGTLIGLERAVSLGARWTYAAPLLSGAGALSLIAGAPDPAGPLLITFGSIALALNYVAILRREIAPYTVTMELGALAWLVGNCLWLEGMPIPQMFWWWAGFLVLTIVGERLELSRLTRFAEQSRRMFAVALVVYAGGLVLASLERTSGFRAIGLGMLLLAAWLARYDFARRTVKEPGLPGFIAVNLLIGYAWLAVAGAAWLWFGDDFALYHYDLMLHTVFLGFVFSMIFAHAPVIFPSVLGRPIPFKSPFYLHTGLLHVSLLLRIGGDLAAAEWAYRWGGTLNVAALALFLIDTGYALLATRLRTGLRTERESGAIGYRPAP